MKYEYKYNLEAGVGITPTNIAELAPKHCDDFNRGFGAFCLWYVRSKQGFKGNIETVADLVADGKYEWLDWLANTPLVEKEEIKPKLTEKDIYIEYNSQRNCASVKVRGYIVIDFKYDGTVKRIGSTNNNGIFPTDGQGRIIIE